MKFFYKIKPSLAQLPLVLVSIFGMLSNGLAAESFLQKPHLYTKGVEGLFSDSHGGYGYVSSLSEAAAEQTFRFSCGGEIATASTEADLLWKSIVPGSPEHLAFVRLRRQLFEYLALRYAAMNRGTRPLLIAVPQCLDSPQTLVQSLSSLPSHAPSNEEILNAPDDFKLLLMKYRSTLKQLTPVSLIYAHLFDLDLAIQLQNDCAAPSPRCTEIQYFQHRLRSDFTPLFSIGDDLRQKFGDELMSFIGNANAHVKSSANSAILAAPSSNASQLVNWEMTLDQFVRASASRNASPAFKHLKHQFHSVMVGSREIWKQYRTEIDTALTGFCTYSMSDILEKFPNVVRQALIEVDDEERLSFQSMLCKSNALEKIRVKPNCSGVSLKISSLGVQTVSVHQKLHSYPFTSVNRFSISKPHSTATEQVLTLPIPLVFDSDITLKERKVAMELWNRSVSDYYNCQAGTLGKEELEYPGSFTTPELLSSSENLTRVQCAKNPVQVEGRSTKFQVNYYIPDMPLPKGAFSVKVHRCFRSEIGATHCASVRTYVVNKCIQSKCKAGDEACKAKCEFDVPPVGSPANNRANSATYLLYQKLGTAIHEAGHLLGLSDEYTDYMLPLNFLGEPDSVMRFSSLPKPRLYPRHFEQILSPLRCPL